MSAEVILFLYCLLLLCWV